MLLIIIVTFIEYSVHLRTSPHCRSPVTFTSCCHTDTISLLSPTAKVLERLILSIPNEHLHTVPTQHGFRPR